MLGCKKQLLSRTDKTEVVTALVSLYKVPLTTAESRMRPLLHYHNLCNLPFLYTLQFQKLGSWYEICQISQIAANCFHFSPFYFLLLSLSTGKSTRQEGLVKPHQKVRFRKDSCGILLCKRWLLPLLNYHSGVECRKALPDVSSHGKHEVNATFLWSKLQLKKEGIIALYF